MMPSLIVEETTVNLEDLMSTFFQVRLRTFGAVPAFRYPTKLLRLAVRQRKQKLPKHGRSVGKVIQPSAVILVKEEHRSSGCRQKK